MTPTEIQKACKAMAAMVGPKADVYVSVTSTYRLSAILYTKGISAERGDITAFSVHSGPVETFEEIFPILEANWREEGEKRGVRVIEKMALEIIRLTAEFGSCTDAALRAEFGESVAKYSTAALSKANEMASNGPFEIVEIQQSNAA